MKQCKKYNEFVVNDGTVRGKEEVWRRDVTRILLLLSTQHMKNTRTPSVCYKHRNALSNFIKNLPYPVFFLEPAENGHKRHT